MMSRTTFASCNYKISASIIHDSLHKTSSEIHIERMKDEGSQRKSETVTKGSLNGRVPETSVLQKEGHGQGKRRRVTKTDGRREVGIRKESDLDGCLTHWLRVYRERERDWQR